MTCTLFIHSLFTNFVAGQRPKGLILQMPDGRHTILGFDVNTGPEKTAVNCTIWQSCRRAAELSNGAEIKSANPSGFEEKIP